MHVKSTRFAYVQIRVPFKIQRILERVATTADTVFQCLMETGVVPPSADLLIPVRRLAKLVALRCTLRTYCTRTEDLTRSVYVACSVCS